MRTPQKLILAVLTALAAGTALADGRAVPAASPIGPLAELTPDERALFRERWREMSPEQRDAVRNRLRQEWQGLPPEQRQQRSQEIFERMRGRQLNGQGQDQTGDRGYGQGYGTRPGQ